MNLCIFEDHGFERLQPLTYLRACFEMRTGRDRLIDKISRHTGLSPSRLFVRPALRDIAAARIALVAPIHAAPTVLINARALLSGRLAPPPPGVAWMADDELIAATVAPELWSRIQCTYAPAADLARAWTAGLRIEPPPPGIRLVRYPWDLILVCGELLRAECTERGVYGLVHDGVHFVDRDRAHVAAGAVLKPGVVLDASEGPIDIDAGAVIEPNCVIQGPCYIGPKTRIQPTAVIRHETSIGPVCKVGGEVEASIIHAYSNKQHDGFLGHSYVAEWVNLGADTVTSDLKNTYGPIRAKLNGVEMDTGQRFLGSIIGDHSKTGIGTILPTGCVIGVAANVFTRGPVPKFVPSFAWLTDDGLVAYKLDKAIELARTVMARRSVTLGESDADLIRDCAATAAKAEAGSPLAIAGPRAGA